MISDNASVMNQPMRFADKEDYTEMMQNANPMRHSIMGNININYQNSAMGPPLPPMPATSHKNEPRTIEVQTELSMVTMEQYSQGYASNAFQKQMNNYKDSVSKNSSIEMPIPNNYLNDPIIEARD